MNSLRTPPERRSSMTKRIRADKPAKIRDAPQETTDGNQPDNLGGRVAVEKYLSFYTGKENVDPKTIERVLWGMTIRPTDGENKNRKCIFRGLLPYENGENEQRLDLVSTANRELIEADIKKCAVYIKDNQTNQRLRSLVSGDKLSEKHYLKKGHLDRKWQLVLLGEEIPDDETLGNFRRRMAEKCGDQNGNRIHIRNETELKTKWPSVKSSTQVLLCVIKEKSDPFYGTVKREVELERGMAMKCCSFQTLTDISKGREEPTITNIALDMVAKTGAYRAKSFFLHTAFPSRFGKAMFLGCKVQKFDSPFVLVGNVGCSDRSASDYECKVARGNSIECLGEAFRQLYEKYKENNGKCLPDKFIFFREGFVPGRHEDRLRDEVGVLKKVVENISVTCIVCRKIGGPGSVTVGDRKTSYSIFLDEIGFSHPEFETLINNLSYSWRYPKPLPAIYANRAAELAEIYMEGNENCDLNKTAQAIDKSLYVIGERDVAEQ